MEIICECRHRRELHGIQNGCSLCDCKLSEQSVYLAALLAAARELVNKMNKVMDSDEYYAVVMSAHIHRGPYQGENWDKEFDALAALLNQSAR